MTDLLTSLSSGLATLTLNRPDALHALNTPMCLAMIEALLAWRCDDSVRAVLIAHAPGTRGFCAGGDIRMLAESGKGDGRKAREFFFTEYQLNHLLFTYNKPVIAIMDGVTMGGGVGISMPARFRIATENTTFAMPETGIGLFPDVGGGWFLPRMPGEVGMWLALTGARLKAADCLIAGVGTHFVEAGKLDALKQALRPSPRRGEVAAKRTEGGRAEGTPEAPPAVPSARPPHPTLSPKGERGAISETLAHFSSDPGAPRELTPENIARIDRIFAADSVEAIVAALEADGSDWAKAQSATLATKSPQTLKVAFRQLREGAGMASFADEMRQEYRIGARVVQRHDFIEGVRALIVDKDNKPAWNPPTLAGVDQAMLDEIFAPLPAGEEWTPL
jgi:enoyl-CoA hydratase